MNNAFNRILKDLIMNRTPKQLNRGDVNYLASVFLNRHKSLNATIIKLISNKNNDSFMTSFIACEKQIAYLQYCWKLSLLRRREFRR